MSESPKLIHVILPVGMLQCNCHIIGDPVTREALIIDPGDDAAQILDVIDRQKLRVTSIAITHAHIDHVLGLRRIQQATGAPVRMHADDLQLYRALDTQAAWIGWRGRVLEKVEVDELLHEGDVIRWGPLAAQVLHTPGHTLGSICLYMPPEIPAAARVAAQSSELPAPELQKTGLQAGRLFAGDTLFAGSIGRTDLWGGSFESIMRSLRGKLLELPDTTIVYPGHGGFTTIGDERETNPFLVGPWPGGAIREA